MKYARVENGIALEIIDFNPVGAYTEEIASQFIQCPDEVEQNWTLKNNVWYPPTQPTIEDLLNAIRADRTKRLAECDWTQLPDVPATIDKVAWVTYRQQLRDFPKTCDPENPTWPVPPQDIAL